MFSKPFDPKNFITANPQTNSVNNIPVLVCWYVEDNGAGQHGYAALDGRVNDAPPDGNGLFQSIPQMRESMRWTHIKVVVPHFEGVLPSGWRIRDLTTNEINAILER